MPTATAVRRRYAANELRQLSWEQLTRFGVRRLNRYDLLLECVVCAARWSPKPERNGSLPRRYWECPNRCNS